MDNDTAKAAPSRRWTAFWLAVFGAGLLLTCFSVLMPLLDLLAQDLTGRTDALRYPDLWRAALVAGVLSALLWLCCVGGLLFASELREFRSWWFTFTLVPLTQGMALGMAHPDGFIANMVLFMVLALLWLARSAPRARSARNRRERWENVALAVAAGVTLTGLVGTLWQPDRAIWPLFVILGSALFGGVFIFIGVMGLSRLLTESRTKRNTTPAPAGGGAVNSDDDMI